MPAHDSPGQVQAAPLLSPAQRASEIIFGIIMTMSILAALRVSGDPHGQTTRGLLHAALACNIAWGMVDGAMYLVNTLIERARLHKVGLALRDAPDRATFLRRFDEITPDGMPDALDDTTVDALRHWYRQHGGQAATGLNRRDLQAALLIWLWVVAATVPLVLPFVVIEHPLEALRTSQGMAVLMLFALGRQLGGWMGIRPLTGGLLMALVGTLITAGCIWLGG